MFFWKLILKKMLANNLKPCLELIINEDQKGFMSQKDISCNIHRVLVIVEIIDEMDDPEVIIDFMK